jgi:hypothetical protein
MTRTVITVLALGYSGSHYLSLLLGSHSRVVHLGETLYLAKRDPEKRKKVCSLCKDNERCPLFHGIGPENIGGLYEMIFSRVNPSVTAIADISKGVRWARRFVEHPTYRMKYLHLLTDPRALMRRWAITYTTPMPRLMTRFKTIRSFPGLAHALLFADLQDIYLYYWLARNLKITEFIRGRQLDAYVISYRDLARDPAGELKLLMEWIGLEYEPTQLEYWNFEHHGSQKGQYDWVKEKKTQHIDLRWQTFLSPETIDRVVTHPAVNDYLRQLGLSFVEDGLTRTGAPFRTAQPIGPA